MMLRLSVVLGFLVILLAGCDEAEQGRPQQYEKGTYQGPADRPLSDQEVETLRQRTLRQGG